MKILYVLLALLILLVLITVHEFGHYIAGKIFKFKINEFSIGFGPAIYKRTKRNGEIFSIRALPLGGYCAFEGEDEDGKDRPGAFNTRPAWQRLIVLISGVLFNVMFGIITSAIYLMVAGNTLPVIAAARNEALTQGLQKGDVIVAVEGRSVEAYRPIADILSDNKGNQTLHLTIERNGERQELVINKTTITNGYFYVADSSKIYNNLYVVDSENPGQYLAVKLDDFRQDLMNYEVTIDGETKSVNSSVKYYRLVDGEYVEYTYEDMIKDQTIVYSSGENSLGIVYYQVAGKYGFFESLGKAWPFSGYVCKVIFKALGGIFTGATHIKDLGGTITTISTIADYTAVNPLIILYLFPMLSLNLAIFNILPIPALDGARAVFVIIEMIRRKPINRKVEGWIHTIGLFVLLGLVLFLDIFHLVVH